MRHSAVGGGTNHHEGLHGKVGEPTANQQKNWVEGGASFSLPI